LLGSFSPPPDSLRVVFRNAHSHVIKDSEVGLGSAITLVRSPEIPARSGGVVFGYAPTKLISDPQVDLTSYITLFGSLLPPMYGFGVILRDPLAFVIRVA